MNSHTIAILGVIIWVALGLITPVVMLKEDMKYRKLTIKDVVAAGVFGIAGPIAFIIGLGIWLEG